MANLQKIIDGLSKLTVLEAAELAKMLEEKWRKEIPTSGLSDEALQSARADLEAWCSPQEFFQKNENLAKRITSEKLFNAPRLQFSRDAMILGEFAIQLEGALGVHLAAEADTFPEGFVETSNGTLNIEVTEVIRETRRREDEYKVGVPPGETVDDWEERAKTIPAELELVMQKKANKHYDPKPTLVVYLNVGFGAPENVILPIIEDAKKRHAASFDGIYVLWEGKLI
jgi:hypothetical protein